MQTTVLAIMLLVWSAQAVTHDSFHPAASSSFKLVKMGNVNVTFLDETNLLGYDGQDFVELGGYRVESRLGMIESCNSANFDTVDGILGFGWANNTRTAALLRTLTTDARPHWNITQPEGFVPMERIFAFTASPDKGELQLGSYDPASIDGDVDFFPMVGNAYGVNVTSITYGVNGPELLEFTQSSAIPLHREPTPEEAARPGATAAPGEAPPAYVGDLDSGTTCLLLPNTTVNGTFTNPPYAKLAKLEMSGDRQPLIYTINGKKFSFDYSECVDSADTALILGDAWFRKYVVVHDLRDLDDKKMGLGLLKKDYPVGTVENDGAAKLMQTTATAKLSARRSILDSADHPVNAVRKVPLVTQRHVTYNIGLSLGTPPQKLEVIFDTGSYMLAVFADAPPAGMIPTGLLQLSASDAVGDVSGLSSSLFGDDSWAAKALLVVNAVMVVGVVMAGITVQRRRHQRNELAAMSREYSYGTLPAIPV